MRACARWRASAGTDIAGLLDAKQPARAARSHLRQRRQSWSRGRRGGEIRRRARAHLSAHRRRCGARKRIEAQGAEIVWVNGTYDDAVDAALAAAKAGEGMLVADTTHDPSDPVSADVLAGYGVMASEIRQQVEAAGHAKPTHLFVQAGCGGLAAAMTLGLKAWLAPPAAIVVVEPEKAACVAAALDQGRVVRVPGDLVTSAEMLSCGEASAPALDVLRAGRRQKAMTVSDAALAEGDRVAVRSAAGRARRPPARRALPAP